LIVASINEDVSRHIIPFTNSFGALKKLKELYDSHSELEVVQLMSKLFNLKLKDDDPISLAFEIRAIMHDIEAIGVKMDAPLTNFFKALHPIYSHYLQSL